MKTLRNLIIFLFFSTVTISLYADMTLSQSTTVTCDDYTGTWQGFMTDPNELFDDGGPWPVILNLYHKKGYLIGRINTLDVKKGHNAIWAQCKNGSLSNIFWGNKGDCGGFSQQGILTSKNVLVLALHYENAMTGTQFLVFLQRKNHDFSHSTPKNDKDLALGKIDTCH